MSRRCGAALLLVVGCTRTDKAGDTAAGQVYPDVATSGLADTDGETDPPLAEDSGTPKPPLAWTTVDMGTDIACGLLNDGRTVCWGHPDFLYIDPPHASLQITVGGLEVCGLDATGAVTCACGNSQGSFNEPCEDVPLESGYLAVRSAAFWACAERGDHTLDCWGQKPTVASAPTGPVLDWSIEENIGCAILEDGSVTCWGGIENFNRWAPEAAVAPPAELTYVQVAVGRNHACALDDAGEVHCWGSTQVQTPFPQASPGPWASITAWNAFTCGLRADGSAECWHDMPGVSEAWVVPDEKWAMLGLGEWDACGVTLDGRGLCFPEVSNGSGEQDIPDLADLVLPE